MLEKLEQVKNRPEDKREIIEKIKQAVNGKIFFTMFGNTEYAGTFIDCDEGGYLHLELAMEWE